MYLPVDHEKTGRFSKMKSRWFTITVDTEEEWDWSSGYPTQSQSVSNIHALPRFHQACSDRGVPVTYFTNHTVLSQPETRSIIQRIHATGMAEIGLHIHPWNTPPLAPQAAVPIRHSFLANLPREEALAKLNSVYESFENSNLPVPTSYRGGRYSTSPWIQEYLVQKGCRADASILPYTTWIDDGAPDFRDRDPLPVRRFEPGWRQALWEIPLTLAFTRRPWGWWRWLYQLGEKSPWRQLRCIGIAERLFVRRIWMNLEHDLGERATELLSVIRKTDLPHVNITLHSSSLKVLCSPYSATSDDVERIYRRLDAILTVLQRWPEFEPVTISDLATKLEGSYHANTRN
jgi:hypothetical protein